MVMKTTKAATTPMRIPWTYIYIYNKKGFFVCEINERIRVRNEMKRTAPKFGTFVGTPSLMMVVLRLLPPA